MNATTTWTALRHRVFRKLWLASVASGCGVAAHDMVATWVMNPLSPPPVLLSLLSTAASLPFFLLTFPAGALAGVVDRKKLLCAMHLWLAAVAGGLALLGGSTGLYSTLGLIRANHSVGTASPHHPFAPGAGFGLGVGVRVELGLADRADSVGSFGWNGLASTFFRVDPAERLVLVVLAQHFPFDEHRLFGRVVNAVYARL